MSATSAKRKRLVLLVLVIASAIAAARLSGVSHGLNAAALHATMRNAGPLGGVVFVAAFVLGVLAYLPGAIFVAAGTLAYGKWLGFLISLFAAILAMCAGFGLARAIGGQQLDGETSPRIDKLVARIERSPILTLAAIRAVLFISPPLNTALALSRIRFRDFAVGSAVGVVLPMAVTTFVLDWLMHLPAFTRLMHAVLG
jgi:uncharacterized membrane protein YdjX (TVP38/TMEM64 family)